MSNESEPDALILAFAVAVIAIICAVALLLTAALGPGRKSVKELPRFYHS